MFRLLELLGGLSVATDLGTGSPLEESLRRCLVATRLARAVGSSEADVRDVLYTALLQHLGCTAYAHDVAEVWGDDVTATRQAFLTESAGPRELWRDWVGEMSAATGRPRIRVLATTLRTAQRMTADGPAATCEVAQRASSSLGLADAVQSGLGHIFAQWNGKGYPATAGKAIPLTARIMAVAAVAVLFTLHADRDAALTEVRRRSGHQLDPELASALLDQAGQLLGDLEDIDAYGAVLDAEPDPVRRIDTPELRQVARTFGHLVDLKSPWLHGHSAAVADLAAAGGRALGLPADAVETLLIAGHLHDLGRTAIPSGIWDKPGPLSAAERDQARLHAYYSERVLTRVPALIEVAKLAGQHHERCDGSGYHRGSLAVQLGMSSRILACADAYRSLVEDRPHRRGLSTEEAAERLEAGARAGALDADAVAGVLRAAGARTGSPPGRPAGLSDRQLEVLRLVARGMSNRAIADRLVISPRTAEHHVQGVYHKIGVSTRAGAALFAMEHGLLDQVG